MHYQKCATRTSIKHYSRKGKLDRIKPSAPMHPPFSHATIDASSRPLETDYYYIPRFFCPRLSHRHQFNFRYSDPKKSTINPRWADKPLNGILRKCKIKIFSINNSFQQFFHCLLLFQIFLRFLKALKLHQSLGIMRR